MKIIKLTAFLLMLAFNYLQAQDVQLKEIIKDDFNKISLCKPQTKLSATIENEKLLLRSILESENELQFKFERSVNEANNVHHHYQFLFKEIPVYGASYVVHSSGGNIDFANGSIPVLGSSLISRASINFEEATKYLQKELYGKPGNKDNSTLSFNDKKLVWFWNNKALVLAYKIEVKNGNVLLNGNYIVDAKNGNTLYFEPFICANKNTKLPPNAPGTAQTLYSGNQNFTTDAFNGQFRLREVRNGVNILTLNASNQTDPAVFINNATDFTDNDNNWQAFEHGNDRYATDVHWATEHVLDYWRTVHNRNSINNQGMDVRSYIHAFSANTLNAFWSTQFQIMMYCDGAGSFGPLGAFDVVAHEIGHGVCQFTAGLTPGTAESGALNEGFSDIWGAAIEAWAAPAKQRWRIGEDVLPPNLRNLENPNDPAAFEGPHPDTYLGTFWRTDGEPHNNSTILSHWFFRLSEGGNGTNDLGNNFIVNGLGINTAARIAYLTEQNLSNSANYNQARNVSIQVTRNTYGVGSCEEIAVTRAWFAVGVGANYAGIIPTPVITGNNAICANGSANYTIDGSSNCLINVTNTWTLTNSNGSSTSATIFPTTGNNTTVSVPSALTSGSLTLTATLSNGAVVTKNIHIGSPYFGAYYSNGRTTNLPIAIYFPPQGSNNIFNDVCIGSSFPNVYADAQPVGASSVLWEVPNGYQNSAFSLMQQTGNRAYFGWNYGGTTPPGYLQASVSNSCGSQSTIFAFKQVSCGTPGDPCAFAKYQKYFTVSPNPSSNFIKIGIGNKPPPYECPLFSSLTTSKGIVFSKINIYDRLGSLLKTMQQKDAKSATVGLDNLIAGSYTVEIISGDYKESHQIIVQK